MDFSNLVHNSYSNSTPYSSPFEFSAAQNQFEIFNSQYDHPFNNEAQSFGSVANAAIDSSPPLYSSRDTLMNAFYSTRPNYFPSPSHKTTNSCDLISYDQGKFASR